MNLLLIRYGSVIILCFGRGDVRVGPLVGMVEL